MNEPHRPGQEARAIQLVAARIVDYFAAEGFSAVTAAEAAAAGGVSRATFFRYFGSKEDVVVVYIESLPMDHAAAVAEFASTDDSPLELVRAALEPAVNGVDSVPERHIRLVELISSEPALRACLTAHRMAKRDAVAEAVLDRVGDATYARLAASVGLAAYDVAWDEWSPRSASTFRMAVDRAFAGIGELVPRS